MSREIRTLKPDDLQPFSGPYRLKVDIDSIYAGTNSLQELLKGFGNETKFLLDTVKDRIQTAHSSRFGMSLSLQGARNEQIDPDMYRPIKMQVCGFHPTKVALSFVPNIRILQASVPGLTRCMNIHLYFIGTKYSSKKPYFTNMQVKVITILLNNAKQYMANNAASNNSTELLDQVQDLHYFECKHGGSQGHMLESDQKTISHNVAKLLGQQLDEVMKKVSTMSQETFVNTMLKLEQISCHQDQSSKGSTENREMYTFAKELSMGSFFVMYIAGCKTDFQIGGNLSKDLTYNPNDRHRSLSELSMEVTDMKDNALKLLRMKLFHTTDGIEDHIPIQSLNFKYHLDVGVEICPIPSENQSFLLNGKMARLLARWMLKSEQDRWSVSPETNRDVYEEEENTLNSTATDGDTNMSSEDNSNHQYIHNWVPELNSNHQQRQTSERVYIDENTIRDVILADRQPSGGLDQGLNVPARASVFIDEVGSEDPDYISRLQTQMNLFEEAQESSFSESSSSIVPKGTDQRRAPVNLERGRRRSSTKRHNTGKKSQLERDYRAQFHKSSIVPKDESQDIACAGSRDVERMRGGHPTDVEDNGTVREGCSTAVNLLPDFVSEGDSDTELPNPHIMCHDIVLTDEDNELAAMESLPFEVEEINQEGSGVASRNESLPFSEEGEGIAGLGRGTNANGENHTDFSSSVYYARNPRDSPNPLISLYPQMRTNGEVGSIHTGKVLLNAKREENGKLNLVTFQSKKALAGLSFYNPKLKHNKCSDCRKTEALDRFRGLPYMLTKLFLWGPDQSREGYATLLLKCSKAMNGLVGLQELQQNTINESGKQRVRFEFFCITKDLEKGIKIPALDLGELIHKVEDDLVQRHMQKDIKSAGLPLKNFVNYIEKYIKNSKHQGPEMFKTVEPNERTTLVYCCERMVESLEIIRDSKSGMLREIASLLKHTEAYAQSDKMFSGLPECCVLEVYPKRGQETRFCLVNTNIIYKASSGSEDTINRATDLNTEKDEHYLLGEEDEGIPIISGQETDTNIYHHVKMTVYYLERRDINQQLSVEQCKKLPRHCNFIGGLQSRDSMLPKAEEWFKLLIDRTFFWFTLSQKNRNEGQDYRIAVLQKNDYRFNLIFLKSDEEILHFYSTICRIMWHAHSMTFFFLIRMFLRNKKSDTSFHTKLELSLESLPTTKTSTVRWYDSQKNERNNGNANDIEYSPVFRGKIPHNFDVNIPTITTPLKLFEECFARGTGLESKRWNCSLAVRVAEYIQYKISLVENRLLNPNIRGQRPYPNDMRFYWKSFYLKQHLYHQIEHCRKRPPNDESHFSVFTLKSRKKRIRFDQIIPSLIGKVNERINITPNITQNYQERMSLIRQTAFNKASNTNGNLLNNMNALSFSMPTKKEESEGKDTFFAVLRRDKNKFQLNDIIVWRVILGYNWSEGRDINVLTQIVAPQLTQLIQRIGTKDHGCQFYEVLATNENSLKEKFKSVMKKGSKLRLFENCSKFALKNRAHWEESHNKKLYLFLHQPMEEIEMENAISNNNFRKVFELAYEGIITEHFLKVLSKLRGVYRQVKGQSSEEIWQILLDT